MNIVFVCTGNTCRSPMAEGFLKFRTFKDGLPWSVISRGLAVDNLLPVSENSVKAMSLYNIDISSHIPTQLSVSDVENATYVITMTIQQKNIISKLLPQYSKRVISIGEFAGTTDVSDPYGRNEHEYIMCSQQIKECIDIIYDKLKNNE